MRKAIGLVLMMSAVSCLVAVVVRVQAQDHAISHRTTATSPDPSAAASATAVGAVRVPRYNVGPIAEPTVTLTPRAPFVDARAMMAAYVLGEQHGPRLIWHTLENRINFSKTEGNPSWALSVSVEQTPHRIYVVSCAVTVQYAEHSGAVLVRTPALHNGGPLVPVGGIHNSVDAVWSSGTSTNRGTVSLEPTGEGMLDMSFTECRVTGYLPPPRQSPE